jgi:hypothetical protein
VKEWKKAAENRGANRQDDAEDVENYVVQRYITNPCRPRPLPSKRSDTCMKD